MTRCIFIVCLTILLAFPAASQSGLIRVPSDVASSHLLKHPAPVYPSLARMANIQGNIVLHILIDEKGNATPYRIVQGHPMLAPAAAEGIKDWKYSPFEFNGHPAAVITVVIVRFGNPANHDVEDKAEVLFQDKFWMAMDTGQRALESGDLALSEQYLTDAGNTLKANETTGFRSTERWQWMMAMGSLRRLQKELSEAEKLYSQALQVVQRNQDKNSPTIAASLSALGGLYYEQKKVDLARENLTKAVSIYEKNYKSAAKVPTAQTAHARAMADDAWMLAMIAKSEHKEEEAVRSCATVLEMKQFLKANQSEIADCELITHNPSPKN